MMSEFKKVSTKDSTTRVSAVISNELHKRFEVMKAAAQARGLEFDLAVALGNSVSRAEREQKKHEKSSRAAPAPTHDQVHSTAESEGGFHARTGAGDIGSRDQFNEVDSVD